MVINTIIQALEKMDKPKFLLSGAVQIKTGDKEHLFIIMNTKMFENYVEVVRRVIPDKVVV